MGSFPVGEFEFREVLSHNRNRVASFYQAIFEIFDTFLKSGLRARDSVLKRLSTSSLMKHLFMPGG